MLTGSTDAIDTTAADPNDAALGILTTTGMEASDEADGKEA